ETAAEGVDGDAAGGGRCPGPPNGFTAGVSSMVRLAGFLGGAHIRARERSRASTDRVAVGAIIIDRPGGRRGRLRNSESLASDGQRARAGRGGGIGGDRKGSGPATGTTSRGYCDPARGAGRGPGATAARGDARAAIAAAVRE